MMKRFDTMHDLESRARRDARLLDELIILVAAAAFLLLVGIRRAVLYLAEHSAGESSGADPLVGEMLRDARPSF